MKERQIDTYTFICPFRPKWPFQVNFDLLVLSNVTFYVINKRYIIYVLNSAYDEMDEKVWNVENIEKLDISTKCERIGIKHKLLHFYLQNIHCNLRKLDVLFLIIGFLATLSKHPLIHTSYEKFFYYIIYRSQCHIKIFFFAVFIVSQIDGDGYNNDYRQIKDEICSFWHISIVAFF